MNKKAIEKELLIIRRALSTIPIYGTARCKRNPKGMYDDGRIRRYYYVRARNACIRALGEISK